MPKNNSVTIGTIGLTLQYTATIPPAAQTALKEKAVNEGRDPKEVVGFNLTPMWGQIPHLSVRDLRRENVDVPESWGDGNIVIPIIDRVAFFVCPQFPRGSAASLAMNGVNVRTGLPEMFKLSDHPRQNYWATQPPWVDGYVDSSHTTKSKGVLQFVFMRDTDENRAFDVATFAGIDDDDPMRSSIAMSVYLPADLSKLSGGGSGYRGEPPVSFSYESVSKSPMRGSHRSPEPDEVLTGAGAVMKQVHEDNPNFAHTDFMWQQPLLSMFARMVWIEQFNEWARIAEEDGVSKALRRQLEDKQAAYERQIWVAVGSVGVHNTPISHMPKLG